jgi:hypothetical protein
MGITDFFSDVWETFSQPSPDAEAPPEENNEEADAKEEEGGDDEAEEEEEEEEEEIVDPKETLEEGKSYQRNPTFVTMSSFIGQVVALQELYTAKSVQEERNGSEL